MMGLIKTWWRSVAGGKADVSDGIHGATHKGRVRKGNEDFFLIHLEKQLYIVSDGMGGHNAGEVASLNATKLINRYFTFDALARVSGSEERIRERMMDSLREANRRIREMARENKAYRGMGCTVVLAWIDGDMLHLCHVGDSRAYLCDRSGIRLLTRDHSYVMSLVDSGKLSMEEARHSAMKNELVQAIGAVREVKPDYNAYPLKDGDRLLVCSDGLWDMLSDDEIYNVVWKTKTAQGICDELIRLANEAGGKDNITTVVVIHRRDRSSRRRNASPAENPGGREAV